MQVKTHFVSNSFDSLRLFLAICVVISHSYVLTGNLQLEPLMRLTHSNFGIGYVAVNGFFVISGYLILGSLERSPSIFVYLKKRFLRIFPALWCLLCFSLLCLGIIYNNVSIVKEPSFWLYGIYNSFLNTRYEINGVFAHNPIGNIVNGSLWTLRYESCCYLLIIPLKKLIKSSYYTIVIWMIFIALFVVYQFLPSLFSSLFENYHQFLGSGVLIRLLYFYASGMLLAIAKCTNRFYRYVVPFCFILLCITIGFPIYTFIEAICFPIFIIGLGKSSILYFRNMKKYIGDLSYGVYIYSFFIQQVLLKYYPFKIYQLIFLSTTLSLVFAFMSWHLVEKRALRYKFARDSSKI